MLCLLTSIALDSSLKVHKLMCTLIVRQSLQVIYILELVLKKRISQDEFLPGEVTSFQEHLVVEVLDNILALPESPFEVSSL